MTRNYVMLFLAALSLLAGVQTAVAQAYPSKPIRLYTQFGLGGGAAAQNAFAFRSGEGSGGDRLAVGNGECAGGEQLEIDGLIKKRLDIDALVDESVRDS